MTLGGTATQTLDVYVVGIYSAVNDQRQMETMNLTLLSVHKDAEVVEFFKTKAFCKVAEYGRRCGETQCFSFPILQIVVYKVKCLFPASGSSISWFLRYRRMT